MSAKKVFSVPVYAYVPVKVQLRGHMEITASSEEEAVKIASTISHKKMDELPTNCEIDIDKMFWDDEPDLFREYIVSEMNKGNLEEIRVNDDDLDCIEEVE